MIDKPTQTRGVQGRTEGRWGMSLINKLERYEHATGADEKTVMHPIINGTWMSRYEILGLFEENRSSFCTCDPEDELSRAECAYCEIVRNLAITVPMYKICSDGKVRRALQGSWFNARSFLLHFEEAVESFCKGNGGVMNAKYHCSCTACKIWRHFSCDYRAKKEG